MMDVKLNEEQKKFLLYNFKVEDINALDDEAYEKLGDELFSMEADEVEEAGDNDLSERGQLIASIVDAICDANDRYNKEHGNFDDEEDE